MKSFGLFLLALEGASAFPAVLEAMDSGVFGRQSNGNTGCTTSALCDQDYPVSNTDIGYDPENLTPAQIISKNRNHCGALIPCVSFDAADQYVSTSGQHAFQSPKSTDLRGPCPGLNAAANHGYLTRNGVQTLTTTITGLGQAYGMSPDLAGILGAYAIAIDGDIGTLTWSIGGPQAHLLALDAGQGISWSHNKYEGDSSISRCDAYTNGGDAHSLSPTRFAYAYSEGAADDRLDMDKFAIAFAKNTHRSIGQNAYYFAPLFSTTLVSPAAYNFVIAMMSNHTSEEQQGYLNEDIFKTFFAVSGKYPDYTWNPGQDRIPDNWYRRPSVSQYTAHTGVFGDLAVEFAAYPDSFRFGGNTNGVNTYTGIDLRNFTGGIYNAQNLLNADNLACFAYQNIQQGLPDVLNANPLTTAATNLLNKYLGNAFGAIACPAVSQFNNNNLPPYQGRSYSPAPPANSPQNC